MRRRCRRSRSRCAPRSPCSTRCATPGRCPRTSSATSSPASRSSSTPACASSRRCASCARSASCGTRSPASATASQDAKQRRFRYGVQVNSLGLTEAQPENNVYRILLEMLAVTMSQGRPGPRGAAAGLERGARACRAPWDQQWSLRMQQVLAFESDLLEYDDLFDGLDGRRGQGRRDQDRRARRDRPHPRDGRRGGRGRVRLPEVGAGVVAGAAPAAHRVRRGRRRRREQVHRDRAQPAAGRRGRRHPHRRPGRRGGGQAGDRAVAGRARRGRRSRTR